MARALRVDNVTDIYESLVQLGSCSTIYIFFDKQTLRFYHERRRGTAGIEREHCRL